VSNVVPFTFEGRPLRVITNNDGSWCVVAKDVVEALDSKWDGRKCVAHVPEQWRMVGLVPTIQGKKQTQLLLEQGLYFYLGRSDKPKALPYQIWIAGEVVPTIRRTGEYRQTYDGAAVLQGIDRLGTKLDLLGATCADTNECVHGFADNQRQPFDIDTKRDVAGCVLRFYGGKCPIDKETVIVDSGGNWLRTGEFDHANGKQNNDPQNCWFVSIAEHRKLRVQAYRIKQLPKFVSFQLDLERYRAPLLNPPPSQIEMVHPAVELLDVPPCAADDPPPDAEADPEPEPEPEPVEELSEETANPEQQTYKWFTQRDAHWDKKGQKRFDV
jgi:BRO family, N-terminal domain